MKLLDIWPHVRGFFAQQAFEAGQEGEESLIPTSAELLERFENGPGTASEHLSGLKAELKSMAVGFSNGLKHGEQTAQDFVAFYRRASGRNFFADIGDPDRLVQTIMAHDTLHSEDDYHVIKQCLDDHLKNWSAAEIAKANDMIARFEAIQ